MAYDKDKYQLTHLLQDLWYRSGQLKRWKISGGTANTIINSLWAGVEEQIYEDDDPALIYGTAVCIQDAGLLGATPEGQFGMITDYDSSTYTVVFDAFTDTTGVGDMIGIASPLFPLQDMIEAANLAMSRIGEIEQPDTSVVIVSGQTEYTLPSTIRGKPLRVRIQTNKQSSNNEWVPVANWGVIPATAGSNWTLVVPPLPSGYKLEILHRSPHPKLTAYDSPILEGIHPELALSATLIEAYQWYNNQVGGSNEYFLQRENKALQDFESARVSYPLRKTVEQVTGMPHWSNRAQYVPGTSDLRA